MSKQVNKNNQIKYTCPFCNEDIKASSKTEIFYRSNWVKGCYNCFALSINKTTMQSFQQRGISNG